MSAPCDLCGADDLRAYVTDMYAHAGAHYDLHRCGRCSLVQVRPAPSEEAIASLYDDDYFDEDYDSCLSADSYFDSFDRLLERYGRLLDRIEARAPVGSLFEIGCAGGYFLKLARDRGWKVRGIEITEIGARHARETLGLDVERRAFPDPSLPEERFDVVYMGHVLEHVRSPAAAIEATTRLVRPGGLLVVEVPTYVDSVYFRTLRLGLPVLRGLGLDASGLLRALKFPAEGETLSPYHLYEFRVRTLRRLLERFGYEWLEAESRVPKPDGLAEARGALNRALSLAFDALDQGALRLGLPGGNVSVIARLRANSEG